MDDLARGGGFGAQFLDQAGVIAVGDEADVLAVGLVRDHQPGLFGQPAHLALGQVAEREAQEIELVGGGAVEEIALVARGVAALPQFDAAFALDAADIMARCQAIGAKLAREGDQVDELDPLVAQRTGHRGAPRGIFVGELVDHPGAEAAFIVEHIMRDAEPVAHRLGIVNVLPRAARAGALDRLAMVVELERDPDHLGAGLRGQHRDDAAVDPARHGDDDPRGLGSVSEMKIRGHRDHLYSKFTLSG